MRQLVKMFLLLLLPTFAIAQDLKGIDSLKHKLSIATNDTSRVLRMIDIGYAYRNQKNDSDFIYGQRALNLSQRIKFLRGEANAYDRLGNCFRLKGDFPKALEFLFKGLQIAEKEHYLEEVGNCFNSISIVYSQLNDFPDAINYQRQALKIFEPINMDLVSNSVTNLGRCYRRNNQLDSAAVYFKKAYDQLESFKYTPRHSHLIREMGSLQFQLGNREKAIEYVRESIEINNKNDDHFYGTFSYNVMAGFFKELNQPDSCIYYAKKALAEGSLINFKYLMLDASTLLAEQLESKDLKEAHYYLKLSKAINDELYGRKNVYELQKTISDEQQRQRNIETQRIAKENQLKQYALILGLGMLLFVAFFLYRNNQKEKKAKNLLQQQKAKVESTLTQLKATQAQLIQSEKLASLGELTAGIAHEIQNPLNFVNNFSELSVDLVKDLKEEIEKPTQDKEYIGELFDDLSQNQEKINHHGKRASSIVKGMLEHSRASTGVKELTDINKLADEYLRLSYHGLRAKDNSFNADYELIIDENLPKTEVIPQDIGRVLLNLINNAFYAVNEKKKQNTEGGYKSTVSVYTRQLDNQIIIKVRDNGIGMSESVSAKVFQPFFTTKPTGQGTGLGLSLAYDIVTKGHGGTLEVLSTEGVGSEFMITLPIKTNL